MNDIWVHAGFNAQAIKEHKVNLATNCIYASPSRNVITEM